MATVVAVVGPTAVGKSDLALELCESLGGEVVNADSMQVYTGMDIGTAKLTPEQRRGVPHHLLDLWPVTRTANVARYQALSREAFADVSARGLVPVLVGGSGLYVRAAVDDLRFPGTDPGLRAELEADAEEVGADAMHARLHEVDPAAAAAVLPANVRRVVRALEVVALTGKPFAASLPDSDLPPFVDTVMLGLRLPRPGLDVRIERRVERMWADGFVEEVRRLEDEGLRQGRTASRAVGYAQVLDLLAGTVSETRAREATVHATRRLVRKQETWFGREQRITWLPADAPDLAARARAVVSARLGP